MLANECYADVLGVTTQVSELQLVRISHKQEANINRHIFIRYARFILPSFSPKFCSFFFFLYFFSCACHCVIFTTIRLTCVSMPLSPLSSMSCISVSVSPTFTIVLAPAICPLFFPLMPPELLPASTP